MGGDTQGLWSFHYLWVKSLAQFGEFMWWDPTSYNGWPAYFYWICGFVNYFNPLTLPVMGAMAVGGAFGLPINLMLIVQKTMIAHAINLTAIMLIARQLTRERLPLFLLAALFSLSEISFHGLRDAVLYESMPASWFLIASFLYLARHRTRKALILFIGTGGIFFAALNYAFLQSGLYWTTSFILVTLLLSPRFFPDVWRLIVQMMEDRRDRWILVGGAVLWCSALAAFWVPFLQNIGHVIRVSGSDPVNMSIGLQGDFKTVNSVKMYELWSYLLAWAPFPEIHDNFLKFDPWGAGVGHRYLGLVTLPLALIALIRGYANRYVWGIAISSAICGLFIIYTWQNPLFRPLLEMSEIFRNIRTMANTMPREGPSVFIMLLATIGLDILLRGRMKRTQIVVRGTMALIMVIVLGSAVAMITPEFSVARHAFAFIAIYLGLYTILALILDSASHRRARKLVGIAMLLLTVMDLSTSAGRYWQNGLVWYDNAGLQSSPNPKQIVPINGVENVWTGSYGGIVHTLWGGPWYGIKEWLVLVSREKWAPALASWDQTTRRMREYPSFGFFSNAPYVPFEKIYDIDSVPPPALASLAGEVKADASALVLSDGRAFPINSGFAGYVEHAVESGTDKLRFMGWAIDERALAPAKTIVMVVGGRLAAIAPPVTSRPDIAAMNPNYLVSGFDLVFPKPIKPVPRIKTFAILADGTARELLYSKGYHFDQGLERAESKFKSIAQLKDGVAPGPFYVHDQWLIAGLSGSGQEVKLPAELKLFTLNTLSVSVDAPQDVLMLVRDNWDPFWKCMIDGVPTKISRANFTYKVVRVPAGKHMVEFKYDPLRVKVVWLVYYAVLLTWLGYLIKPSMLKN